MTKTLIVAIDGPAAAGKGTLARRLAEHLGLAYLDTGLLYRAVGVAMLRAGHDLENQQAAAEAAQSLDPALFSDPELRLDHASQAASKIAAIPEVRAALLDFQRRFAHHPPSGSHGVVLDGRDIGTVVCPDAPFKLFITASVEKRADRRLKELRERGVTAIQEAVLQDMKDRDARDSQRSVAPLVAAPDAYLLDTTELDAEQAFAAALSYISSRR